MRALPLVRLNPGLLALFIIACGGPTQEGPPEPSNSDAGTSVDEGVFDSGVLDAGVFDAGVFDAGVPDAGPRLFRILFDAAHDNSVGNADWVLDTSAIPSPVHPTSETQWSGGISAWGFDLHTSGRYEVRQVPSGTALNFGGGGAGDLRGFDVFISDEPEQLFTSQEQAALMQFAQAGGGLFFVADHSGAKRCSTCTEAWRTINGFLVTGAGNDLFGVKCDGNNIAQSGVTGTPAASPVTTHFTTGHFGDASGLSFHSGTSVSPTGSNPAASVVVTSPAGGFMISSSLPSGGRLVLLGDSSPADDGTCTGCGATLYDGWGEVDNARFILNATAWAAHDGS